MPPQRASPIPVSAPDLIGPTSILEWPTSGPSVKRRRSKQPFTHVHLDIDLKPGAVHEPSVPILRQFEAFLREREVVEAGDLLRLAGGLLHAMSAQGYSRVDHWEVEPGGWLPLPEPTHARVEEPVGHLVRALASDAWSKVARARAFSVRLSGPGAVRADVVVRRVHRERTPTLSIDLHGRITPSALEDLVGALRQRLPVYRTRVGPYSYT